MSSRHISRALLTRAIDYRCFIAKATLSSLQADHLAAGTNDLVLFKEPVQLWGEVTEGLPQVDWFPFQTIHTRAGVPREANWQPVRMHFIYKGGKAEPVAWEVTAIALQIRNAEHGVQDLRYKNFCILSDFRLLLKSCTPCFIPQLLYDLRYLQVNTRTSEAQLVAPAHTAVGNARSEA